MVGSVDSHGPGGVARGTGAWRQRSSHSSVVSPIRSPSRPLTAGGLQDGPIPLSAWISQ